MAPISYLCRILLTALALGFVQSFKKPSTRLRRSWELKVSPTRSPPSPQKQKLPSFVPSSESWPKKDTDVWKGLTAAAKEKIKK